jgi:hypothetical protein
VDLPYNRSPADSREPNEKPQNIASVMQTLSQGASSCRGRCPRLERVCVHAGLCCRAATQARHTTSTTVATRVVRATRGPAAAARGMSSCPLEAATTAAAIPRVRAS